MFKTNNQKLMIIRVVVIIIIIIMIGGVYQLKKSNSSRYTNLSLNTNNKSVIRLIDYGSKPCSCRPKPTIYEDLEKKYLS